MASPTWYTWVWVSFGSWWWIGKPCTLQSMGPQRVGHDWATELNFTSPSGDAGGGEQFHSESSKYCLNAQLCPTPCDPTNCSLPRYMAGYVAMGFSRQEYWSGLPFSPPGNRLSPGLHPCFLCLLHWQADSLPLSHPGKPKYCLGFCIL